MKRTCERIGRKGSVMMEFIVVFPIYLVLFGAIFVLGDMLIHSNRLASGDRIDAFDVEGWTGNGAWNCFRETVFNRALEIDDRYLTQDILIRSGDGRNGRIYADGTGPWTVCAGSRVVDDYRPPAGGALGQLLYADWFFSREISALDAQRRNGEQQLQRDRMLLDWELDRRVTMRSKGGNLIESDDKASYSFYTLKRRRTGGSVWRDGWFTSALLPNERWRSEVANEAWHTESTVRQGQSACTDVTNLNRLEPYKRYKNFENKFSK